jgi:hypothetical protein
MRRVLELGKVVDLIPNRESGTVATWLREHPGTEIVSRDRATAYAEATRRAAPHAAQIADRWQPPAMLSIKQKNRNRRQGLYEQMRALMGGGVSQSDIARQLDLGLRTVRRWIRIGAFPERIPRLFPNAVDTYAAYLDRRLLEGCRNVSQLWRELKQQGFPGQHSRVWHWLRQRRGNSKKSSGDVPLKSTLRTSPQHTARQMLKGTPSAQLISRSCIAAHPRSPNSPVSAKSSSASLEARILAPGLSGFRPPDTPLYVASFPVSCAIATLYKLP